MIHRTESSILLRALFAWPLLALAAGPCAAHYNMLLPSTAWAKKGEKVTFTHQWGHPFEHELSDAPAIRRLYVTAPDGTRTDLLQSVETIKLPGADNKPATAHRFAFTPEARGDYTLVLETEPVFLADQKEAAQDIVKVVLHVQTQNGWDRRDLKERVQLIPLTRPYGLLPGMVLQARVQRESKIKPTEPAKGAAVEWERYNPVPPKQLPDDEFITFRATTDPNGVLTCTLPDPGWWGITVSYNAGTTEVQGQAQPLRQRLTLWVHVGEKN